MTNKTQKRTRKRKISDNNTNNNDNASSRAGRRLVGAPAAIGAMIRPPTYTMTSINGGQEVRIRGRDVLGALVGSSAGSVIAGIFDMNPACWNNSRLSLIAKTFEKYKFHSFSLHYIPSVSTSTSGMAATYYEPEVYDNVINSVTGALTHFNSTAGPTWSPHSVTVTIPRDDPTVYLCTEKTGIERGLLSQGKSIFLNESTASGVGVAYIEYDLSLLYPELENGYPGEQYVSTAMTVTAAAGGVISTAPALSLTGIKVAEVVMREALNSLFVNSASNFYDLAIGTTIYTAWDGTAWRLYPELTSALAKNGPLSSVNAIAGVVFLYSLRKLVAPPA